MIRAKKDVSQERIAKRAYEIWEARGCPPDDGVEEWVAAEAEVLADARQGRLLNLKDFFR